MRRSVCGTQLPAALSYTHAVGGIDSIDGAPLSLASPWTETTPQT